MATFAEWLESVIERRGLTATQVAAYAGVSGTMVTNWRRGALPRPESLRKLAAGLNLPYEELAIVAGYIDPPAPPSPSTHVLETGSMAAVPGGTNAGPERREAVLRLAEMALPGVVLRLPVQRSLAHAGADGADAHVVYLAPERVSGRYVALEVAGDCMEPAIRRGDVVIIDADASPLPGDLVAVEYGHQIQVRIYQPDAGELRALNAAPLRVDDVTRLAPVIAIQRSAREVSRRLRRGEQI